MPSNFNTKRIVALVLWVLFFLSITVAGLAQGVADNAFADLAREKDIVWLSLVTGLACISFSAWLVKELLKQGADTVKALRDIRDELKSRPCYFPREQRP